MRNKNNAFTLIEVVISASILVIILSFIIPFMRDTSKMSSLATMKGTLRQEAQMVLRTLDRDIASSRVKFEKINDDGTELYKSEMIFDDSKIEMEVSKGDDSSTALIFETSDDDDSNYVKVTYTWGDGTLVRNHATDGTTTLARHIKSITKGESNMEYDGKVRIDLVMEADVPGSDTKATHEEFLIVAIRQLQNKFLEGMSPDRDSRNNKRWRQKYTD